MGFLTRDYTELAEKYDERRFHGANGAFLYETDAAIIHELVELADASTVLDVACGTGRVLDYLQGIDARYIGCDLTRAMLERAVAKLPVSRDVFLQCDASQLPIASATVDCVVSLRFLHMFPFEARCVFVREYARVLRPGGHLVCSFTNGWYAGGLNWVNKLFGRRHEYFLAPGELRKLFPGWKVCALRGNFLPLQWRVAAVSARTGHVLQWLNSRPPLNYLCWERFYLLKKPE